jgi:hypothetical protein
MARQPGPAKPWAASRNRAASIRRRRIDDTRQLIAKDPAQALRRPQAGGGSPVAAKWEFVMPKRKTEKWSADVTEHSDAMDLEDHVFEGDDPHKIALSIKRSAEHSKRRKAEPYQSAMSMLNFYINRAGKNLSAERKRVLEKSKDELRKVFGREAD